MNQSNLNKMVAIEYGFERVSFSRVYK